jgi:hypothetical protein
LDSRRQHPNQPNDLSITQRRGWTTKPTLPARRRTMISTNPGRKQASRAANRL